MCVPVLAVCVLCASAPQTRAATSEQDRRIEEEKRQDLAPTAQPIAPPETPPAPPDAAALPKPPVPMPAAGVFVATVAQKPLAFNYDAAKGVVLLLQVDEQHITLDAQVAYLREHGIIPARMAFEPAAPLCRGVLAVMLQRALKIRGGLGLRLFGSTPRYALKELTAQGMMAGGLPRDLVSGPEFVQALNGAVEYRLKSLGPPPP